MYMYIGYWDRIKINSTKCNVESNHHSKYPGENTENVRQSNIVHTLLLKPTFKLYVLILAILAILAINVIITKMLLGILGMAKKFAKINAC